MTTVQSPATSATSATLGSGASSSLEFSLDGAAMLDLAPEIHRQRLVIEGIPAAEINELAISGYLRGLSDVCDMVLLTTPVTHRSDRFGWAGWIHWETSGAHFYAWDQPKLFFSVDIYTCKAFDPIAAISYTEAFFETSQIVAKEF
jgi:S-adenosylmethionine decarboxylase